jgi:hypothetical protein
VIAPPEAFCPVSVEPPPAPSPVVGRDICACHPATFTLELDLSGNCDTDDFKGTSGIGETVCAVLDDENKLSDRVPVAINKVQITEFDQTFEVILTQKTFDEGNYSTGDVFEFVGSLAANGTITEAVSVPGSLLVEISGVDESGNLVDNTWVLDFTNECGTFPVIAAGQRLSWAVVVRVGLFVFAGTITNPVKSTAICRGPSS